MISDVPNHAQFSYESPLFLNIYYIENLTKDQLHIRDFSAPTAVWLQLEKLRRAAVLWACFKKRSKSGQNRINLK